MGLYKAGLDTLVSSAEEAAREDFINLVNQLVESCRDYVCLVEMMPMQITIARTNLDDVSEYQNFVVNLDRRRRNAHNVVISGIRNINRLCSIGGCHSVFEGLPDDGSRAEVYWDIAQAISEEFKDGVYS